ncbi:hypothetical protein CEUSTIGMA_g11975.t1 [Chlamydomonas eustigma]|uniref:Alpha-1,3-glucosyltransferase n=1 Tax=Chlamydomonas eustigma TaxID=1157962 RepID=A0A250XN89_9CHLO|nr:hypothetical protein CEUSTIGMA_g11975.t1 [Chlamydomonas eustigma]|eukprot:GAX84554.1 hypothetical protein CEUSTIGMA_g11975.t1 [Chlamydomonas eustigma]
MGLFYAPAFFAHLLGWCLQHRKLSSKVAAFVKLGLTVIVTFALCWAPCIRSPGDTYTILRRIFPIKRGLFEDYVANFWCATSVLIKWKSILPQDLTLKLCAGITLLTSAPSMLHQMMRPSPRGLLMCMANTSMAFFMFSFQVHEKSILLPLLPMTLLAASEPTLVMWSPLMAMLSMYPLLHRDGVIMAYSATALVYLAAMAPSSEQALQVLLFSKTRKQVPEAPIDNAATASGSFDAHPSCGPPSLHKSSHIEGMVHSKSHDSGLDHESKMFFGRTRQLCIKVRY